MKPLSKKLAAIICRDFGMPVYEGKLAKFLQDRFNDEVRTGTLSIGGVCDGEFCEVPYGQRHFKGYSQIDMQWDLFSSEACMGPTQKAVETSTYEMVPLRMTTSDGHTEDIFIACEVGLSPAEMVRKLIKHYRPT